MATGRALALGLLFLVGAGFWIRASEIVASVVYVTESIPAIPAVAALLILLFANYLLRRSGRRLTPGELVFAFCFVCVGAMTFGVGVVRFLLALITAPFYFAQTGNRLAEAQSHLPKWAAVHDPEAVRALYESLRGAPIPWHSWGVPVLAWTGFLLALWVTLLCLVLLMYRPWIEREKLSFPLLQLPLELAEVKPRNPGEPAFLRNPMMWAGFGLAVAYNAVHIAHALWPTFPGFQRYFSFAPFSTPPWSAVGTLTFHYRPELIGFGYLVSTEISFTIWVTYVLERLVAVIGSAWGYREAGFPFDQEQSMGAYLAIALVLLYYGRHHLAAAARAALSSRDPEMRAYRLPFWGFWAGLAAMLLFCHALGMRLWVAGVYLGIVLCVGLVYARLRAEIGVPLIWLFPYGAPKMLLLSLFGTAPLAPGGDPATLTGLAALTFLSRGFPVALAGYQIDALRAGHFVNEKPRRVAGALTLALVAGVLLAFYFHLTGYYKVGAQQVRGGIWGWDMACTEFNNAITWSESPKPRDLPRCLAAGSGFLTALLLQAARSQIIGFPLHPLGFAAGNAYGRLLWGSFLLVWVIKGLVLRLGGMPLYRKTVPAFLGFALGHFLTAGVVWGFLGTFGKDLYQGYIVVFG